MHLAELKQMIEKTIPEIKVMDELLGFANDEQMLILFKKLCRYYYSIDPEATVFYVNAYRRRWIEDEI